MYQKIYISTFKIIIENFFLITIFFLVLGCKKELPEYIAISYNELPDEIDFNLDVKPILSDKCYSCHGPDEGTRKAAMRFDTENGLYEKTLKGNFPVKSGNLSKSELIHRILSEDPAYIMPPSESHLNLTTREKAILVKWVEQGAKWKKHWAFIPPVKSIVPIISNNWTVVNEIDAFVFNKLIQYNLEPNIAATKEKLLRRVTIDLTGLPPTLNEINDFINDKSPDAYEKVVDRLLQSISHAERLTLEWMDVARYGDSHGYHADGSRMMWQWRDWTINAFFKNKPYDEFVTEQLAGDLMPNATKDQILATAFNRNHPTTAEGGAIDEEFRVEYVTNRTNTFGTAFLGLTLECAKCHDHKFDPISQKDYFQLFAYFNNIKELGMTSNDGNSGPLLLLTDSLFDEKMDRIQLKIDSLEVNENLTKLKFSSDLNFRTSNNFKKTKPIIHHSFESISPNKKKKMLDNISSSTVSKGVTLEKGIHGLAANFDDQYDQVDISKFKAFEKMDPFSVSIWVYVEKRSADKTMTIIGNSSVKHELYRGWDLYLESNGQLSSRLISALPNNYIHIGIRDSIPLRKWTHVLMTYDGTSKAGGLNIYLNGQSSSKDIKYDHLYKSIIPQSKERLIVGKSPRGQTGDNGIFIGKIDELSIYDFEIPPPQVSHIYEQSKINQNHFAWNVDEESNTILKSELKQLRQKQLEAIDTVKEIMVMQEMPDQRKTYILQRGAYNIYGDEVQRATPKQFSDIADDYPKNRLGLSQWLFDKKNPLTARVAVNRYWQMIFGRGLVSTTNDFGNQGSMPTHPELLDWIAIDFIESGWDLRHLIKKMVMSNTYMQSSKTNKKIQNIDPENNLLARTSSYRLQAEFIRNIALKSSGLLNEKVGGESVKPYQPEGLWIEKGNFSKVLLHYVQDHDDKQYRKSMYTFYKRTSPPPYMEIFDMPGRVNCIVSRERTNTPLQALSLLNDPQFVEASKSLAYRMKNEGSESIQDQITTGFLLVLSRKPSAKELEIMENLYMEELVNFKLNYNEATAYIEVGDYKIPKKFPVSEMAAMTLIASTLFNMDEMYTKR